MIFYVLGWLIFTLFGMYMMFISASIMWANFVFVNKFHFPVGLVLTFLGGLFIEYVSFVNSPFVIGIVLNH